MIKRRFIFGDEWLYIKLYSGPKILEEILLNQIYPILEYFYASNVVNKFFFVKYFDDAYNLRLRFRLSSSQELPLLLNTLSDTLRNFSNNRILSKTIVDVYNREIERYGTNNIEQIETIFSVNSWEILKMLQTEEDYENRWLYGIKIMDNLLNKFGLTATKKYDLYQACYLSYFSETGKQISIKNELKKIYRSKTKKIDDIINASYSPPEIPNAFLKSDNNIDYAVSHILKLERIESFDISFENILQSIIHMHYNRVFRIKQRQHELVIYYMMSNFYKSQSIIAQKL